MAPKTRKALAAKKQQPKPEPEPELLPQPEPEPEPEPEPVPQPEVVMEEAQQQEEAPAEEKMAEEEPQEAPEEEPPEQDAGIKVEDEQVEEEDEEVEEEEGGDLVLAGNNGQQEAANEAVHNGQEQSMQQEVNVQGSKDSANVEDSGKDASPARGKIFIGGLTWETTTEMLTNHFKKYGEITDSVIMKNRTTGHPRGFGFVTFADPSVCDMVLKDNHVIDGRTVEAKRTVPREKMSAGSKGPKTKKIFVGGLTTATTEEEFSSYFAKFGKIVEHQIMQDHSTGRSRGFGFVTFDSEQVVEDILAQGRMHELGGKQVEIKKAEPKRSNQESFGGYSSASVGAGYFAGRGGAGYPNAGAYAAYAGGDAYYGGGGGYYSRGGGRLGGYPEGGAYGYGGGYGGSYGYGDPDDVYGGLGYNLAAYGSGSGYSYNYGGAYGGGSRAYGGGSNGRYHPYGR